ncbi:OmpP1/FadL family transporter [Cardiobacteriaceae bacterium TAE3-ERU3]|nr:OmpP1/FadL family transporter [Cardiobacteriaceae bacterium TAE3-ERU3]
MNHLRISTLSAIIITAIAAQSAWASGYHFGTQSVSVQATSNASSAEAASPATIFYNPAGLSKLSGTQITGNLITAFPSVKYSNAQGGYFNPKGQGLPIKGESSGSITKSAIFVPHLYASYQFSPQLTAGLGVYVPFGAGTEYDDKSIMRYSVKKTEMKTFNIHPTIAYDFQNGHSIGGGVFAQYMNASLGKTVDFGPSIQGALQAHHVPPAMAQALAPSGASDINVDIEGNDWGFGYSLGWMWDINDNARIGLSYRSKVEHTLKGTAKWTPVGTTFSNPTLIPTPHGALPAGATITQMVQNDAGYKPEENASVKIVTPESLSLHGMFKVSPQVDLFGDVTWTRHSRFNNLNINYENTKTVPNAQIGGRTMANATMLKPNWRDTYKVSVGGAYQLNDQWQLRGGIGYDQSPVRSAEDRLSTMPDNDRLLLSLGAKYDIDDNQTLDFAYTYIHIKDAKVDSTGYCGGKVKAGPGAINCVSDRTNASADYKSNAHFLGLQYTYRF